ncbi:MAG TPA: peptidoglycan recognition family protein [bacterium]|nr:peptidoglycan recognition family protein [bacterium]
MEKNVLILVLMGFIPSLGFMGSGLPFPPIFSGWGNFSWTDGRMVSYLPEAHRWKYIVIHHSATERGNAAIFDKGHRLRGFAHGLGYHFVVDNGTYRTRMGQIESGDRWYRQMNGAHCNRMGMNEEGIGICLVGNFSKEKVSSEQLDSAVWLVKHLQKRYGIPTNHVLRHRDVKKKETECPGNDFPWEEFVRRLG